MIESADEFRRLRTSDDPAEYGRAAHEEAPVAVWREVIARYPDLRSWVAHNKTVPGEILAELAGDSDPEVGLPVASKRSLAPALQLQLAGDADEGVRRLIVYNARAARAALGRLADDRWAAVAEHARALGGWGVRRLSAPRPLPHAIPGLWRKSVGEAAAIRAPHR